MDLDFVRIECDVVADAPSAQLSAVLHEAVRNFEVYFKASCCCHSQRDSCAFCVESGECPYWIVFSRQLSTDPEVVRIHQKPSLPFSLYIILVDSIISSYTIGIVVIGSALNYLELFYATLLNMVETCIHTMLSPAAFSMHCYSLDYQGVRNEIRHAESLPETVFLLSGQYVLANSVHSNKCSLLFISPLRLLCNGSIAHQFDFAMFFRSQLRRCSSLCAYYGTGELPLDFTGLSKAAQNVTVLRDGIRYTQPGWSKRQNRAGLTGSAECSGLIEPMYSLLLFGSYFNAGKGASYGAGFYQLNAF